MSLNLCDLLVAEVSLNQWPFRSQEFDRSSMDLVLTDEDLNSVDVDYSILLYSIKNIIAGARKLG